MESGRSVLSVDVLQHSWMIRFAFRGPSCGIAAFVTMLSLTDPVHTYSTAFVTHAAMQAHSAMHCLLCELTANPVTTL
jgi:hypothetical protein